jgi:hypothetical protein
MDSLIFRIKLKHPIFSMFGAAFAVKKSPAQE